MTERPWRWASWGLTFALLAAHVGLFSWLRHRAPQGLRVVITPAPTGPRVRLAGSGPASKLFVDGRARAVTSGLAASAGLHQARWERRYLGRPARSLAHTYLVAGPASPSREGWAPRAALIALGQHQLDGPAVDDLASALEQAAQAAVRRQLAQLGWVARHIVALLLGALREVRVHIEIVPRGLQLNARVRFVHDGQRLDVAVRAPVHLALRRHRLQLGGGGTQTRIATQTRPSWWRRLRAFVAAKVLERALPERVDTAFAALLPRVETALAGLLSRRLAIAPLDLGAAVAGGAGATASDPNLQLETRPSALQIRPGEALRLALDVRVRGPRGVALAPALARPAAPILGAPVGAWLSRDALNGLLMAYWQAGTWDALGAKGARRLQASLDPRLSRLLAFKLRSLRLLQAPMLMEASRLIVGPWRLQLEPLADVELPRLVDLHGRLAVQLRLHEARQQLELRLVPTTLASSCGEGTEHAPLRPCFSELVGLGAGWLREQVVSLRLGPGPAWRRLPVHLAPLGRLELAPRLRGSALDDRGVAIRGRIGLSFIAEGEEK